MHELQVVESDPGYCLARLGGIQIQLWRGDVPLKAARAARDAALELPYDLERGLLIVTEASGRPPEGEARRILTDLGLKLDGAVGCAFVSEGEGFVAASLRGIMTGMMMLARPAFPVRVFASVREATAWLAGLASSHETSELREAVATMRQLGL